MNGWIKLHRQILENPVVMKDSDHLSLWTYILLNATHSEYDVIFEGKRKTLIPGEFTTGRNKISKDLSISSSKVQRILKCFESEQQIEQVTDMKCRLIRVLKWNEYQGSEQVNEQLVNKYRTSSEQVVNTKQEGKKKKNAKNEKNIVAIWNSILPIKGKNETIKQGVPVMKECRKETDDIRGEMRKLKYSKQEIVASMLCYRNEICSRGGGSYAEHRFSLWEFLKQTNGCRKFMQDVSDEMVKKVDDFYFKNKNEQN